MAEAPPGPPFGGSQNTAPITPLGQSPALGPPPPPVPPPPGVPGAALLASVVPSRRGSGLGVPTSGTPTTQFPPRLPPPAAATPSREALGAETPQQRAAPPAPTTTGPSKQQQPQEGTGTAAAVGGVSSEWFNEFAEMQMARKFAELTEMAPQVKRLMDMGGSLEDLINLPRNYEGPMVRSGSGFAGPPMRRRGSLERPMYDAPMRLPPGYGGPPDRYAGPLDRYAATLDRYNGPPGRYDGPPGRYDGPPDRYNRPPGRYDHPPDSHDGPVGRYDDPSPNARSYGRRAFPGERSRIIREDYELPGRAPPKQHSQRTASDLLLKIRKDIEEHCAESMFQQIHGGVADYETDEEDERRVRGGSIPQSRTTFRGSYRDDDGESRRTRGTNSSTRRFRDDYDAPRRKPSPGGRLPRWRHESSSTSSSSDVKSRLSCTRRRRKMDSTKGLKSRSKRRSKSKTKRSSSSSSSSSSRGLKRRKGKSSKKKSSSSSSSSFSDVRRGKKKGKAVEFKRSVTGRMPSEAQKDLESVLKHCEVVVKSLSTTLGGNGCPLRNTLGKRSHEQEGLNRPSSRNIVDVLPMGEVEERCRSGNFGGEVVSYNSVSRPVLRNLGREVESVQTPPPRDGVQRPPSKSFGGQAQRMSSHGSVYRYESQPSAFSRE